MTEMMAGLQDFDQYDYLRVTMADICGASRGKVVPRPGVSKVFKDGLPICIASTFLGPRSENPVIPEMVKVGYGNGLLILDPKTLHPVPWAGYDEYKVGEVFCEMHWYQPDGSSIPQQACPRQVAKNQIQRLNNMGYDLLSSFEMEFMVVDKQTRKTRKPIFSDYVSQLTQAKNERFLFKLEQNFKKAGLEVDVFHAEYASGQFEFTFQPSLNIGGADDAFLFKEGIKQMVYQQGLQALFMTTPFLNVSSNGAHYNHSVIHKTNGKNALHDEASENKLSTVAHHWLGGLFHHTGALTALCAPTVNCYRRFHNPWAPSTVHWGIDDRMAAYRAKNVSSEISYIESRLPGGSCNPYVVLAATVAGGIDGVINRLECPPPGHDDATAKIANSLEEALQALENDATMVESLGAEFVDGFLQIKRQVDLKQCPHPLSHNDLDTEYEEYAEF